MKTRSTFYLFLVGLFCLVSSAVIGQTTRFVSTTGTNSDPASATSWATATTDLQGAINSLTATGGEVWVAGGVYKPTQGTDRSVNWVLPPNVDLYGGFAGSETAVSDRPPINPTVGQYSSTTLSGDIGTPEDNSDNSNQLIFIQSGSGSLNTTSIDGFVLTGANGLSAGGAIHSPTTQDITIVNCYFYRNTSTYGGAFYHEPNSLNRIQISSCLFEENSSVNGGAIFAGAYRAIALNCIFRKNTANTGGAIYTFYFMNIWQCLFESNTATAGSGGAVNAWSGGANINAQNCSFVNNSATVDGGALTLITIASGGAGVARIQTCSFQGNRAGGSGGAILHNSNTSNPAVAPISNSVFFNNGGANTITNVSANPIPLNYNLAEAEVLSVTGLSTGTGNLIATSSPFASTTSNQLNPCSPAINSGDPSVTTNTVGRTDVTGQVRFYNNGRVDMGAYEYQSDPTTITLANPTVTTADVGVTFSQSFSASGGSSPYSYSLLSGSLPTGLTFSSDGTLSGTPTQAGSFTMVVRATDNAGCQGDGTAYVLTVTSIALAGFDVSPDPICVGRPATFSATVSNVTGSYSYTLTNGSNPLSSTSTSPTLSQTLTATGSGTQTFTLTVAQSGYAANATTTLTVKNSPTANILVPSSSTLTCTTTSLALTATGGGSYRWDNSSTSATRTVTASGTYSVTVTIPNGCSSIDNQIITSDTASPTATIQPSASTTLTCATTSLALTATGGGSYHWDNNTTNAVRTVNASGTYSVTVTGSNGCTAVDSQTISSDVATPVLSLTATNGCSGQDVILIATSGLTNYTFYGPSGVIQSGQTSSTNVSGLSAGTYSFSVAAQHPTSLCSTTATATATVSSLPSLTITASPSLTISSGNAVTLTASGAASYIWTGGTGDTFTASPTSTTPYSVTGVNASGCSSSTTVTVTVNAPAISINGFAATSSTVCVGSVATFTATVGNITGAYDYTLTNGTNAINGSSSSTGFSQTVVVSGSGSQSFSLIVSQSGASALASTALTVGSHPDYQALVDLYNATNGPGWTNKTGWLKDCNPCGWFGVTCSVGRVTQLSLQNNQLSGSIPASLSALTNLHSLNLGTNQLSGSIPANLSTLSSLLDLALYNNQLSGSIPASLSALTSLLDLALNNNQLSGSIPASLSALTSLQYLTLDNNQLSGSIPANLAALTSLQTLNLNNNQLSGCYPASLTTLCGISVKNFTGNAGLPDGGSAAGFAAFCSRGQGSDAFVATATASVSAVCIGGVVSLSTSGGSSYSWTAPSGAQLTSSATSSVVSASLSEVGVQTFTVVVNNGGTCSQTATVSVSVDGAPPASISLVTTTLTCATPTLSLTATGGDTYRWEDNSTNAIRTVSSSGTYSVTVTSSNGCTATASTVVSQSTTITGFSVTGSATVCTSGQVSLTASGCSGGAIAWPGGITGAVFSTTISGQYTATCTIGSCSATASGTAAVGSAFTLTTPSTSTALVGVPMGATLDWSTSGGTSPYSFSFSTLPSGLSVVTASADFRAIGGTPTQTGTFPISLTVTDNLGCAQVAAPFSLTVNCPTLTPGLIPTPSATLTCAQTSLTLTTSGGSSYAFAGPGIVSQNASAGTAVVNTAGTYSVIVTNSVGCSAITTTTISSNTVLSLATGASLPMANVGVVVSLTASGATAYQWSGPSTAPLTTPATGSAVSVSLTTAGVQTFTVVATAGVCRQSALVSVTALAGPDLSAIMSLPDGNFTAGESKGLLVQLQEVNGAVSSGSIIITITVPTGYSISFDNTLTSINVSGGTTNPVAVENSRWHVSNTVAGQQLSLAINGGEWVGANSTLNLGFTITRTTANAGSTSNITINVADDGSGSYDVNRLNNIYARIISGL